MLSDKWKWIGPNQFDSESVDRFSSFLLGHISPGQIVVTNLFYSAFEQKFHTRHIIKLTKICTPVLTNENEL